MPAACRGAGRRRRRWPDGARPWSCDGVRARSLVAVGTGCGAAQRVRRGTGRRWTVAGDGRSWWPQPCWSRRGRRRPAPLGGADHGCGRHHRFGSVDLGGNRRPLEPGTRLDLAEHLGELVRRRRAVGGLLRHRPHQHTGESRRAVGAVDRRRRLGEDPPHRRAQLVAGERRGAGDEVVERGGERVDVGRDLGLGVLEDLRRGVGDRQARSPRCGCARRRASRCRSRRAPVPRTGRRRCCAA